MTHSVNNLQQLCALALVQNPVQDGIPPHLVDYVAGVVNLSNAEAEFNSIQQSAQTLAHIIQTGTPQEFDNQYQDLLQLAGDLANQAGQTLANFAQAIAFLESVGGQDEWVAYYLAVCQSAWQALTEIKDRCEVFVGDFQNYQPGMLG